MRRCISALPTRGYPLPVFPLANPHRLSLPLPLPPRPCAFPRFSTSSSPPSPPPPHPSPSWVGGKETFVTKAKEHGAASLLGNFIPGGGFDTLLSHMRIDTMDPSGLTVCTLPLSHSPDCNSPTSPTPPHTLYSFGNSYGKLHGGVYALLTDVVGTLAILAKDASKAGVSVDIQTSYFRSVELSDSLRCEGRVLKAGGRLCFTEVRMFRQSDNKLVAVGKHIKGHVAGRSRLQTTNRRSPDPACTAQC